MSAKKEDRWVGTTFRRQIGKYTLLVWGEADGWWWDVSSVGTGSAPDEKTAKLKARRVVDACLRRDAKGGRR